MKSVLVAGYRHTDLGIFSEKDPRVTIIKVAIQQQLRALLEEGVEWFVFTGQLGFESWVLAVLRDLQAEGYDCQIATVMCFATHGRNWNEANQEVLARFKAVDFVKYAYESYESPGQFRDYNRFLVDNTDGAYLFYDSENETNLKYLLHEILTRQEYTRKTLTFEDLNAIAENFEEIE